MKKLTIYSILISFLAVAGCTKNFESINTDPTQANATTFNPNLLLSTAELSYANTISGYGGPILFQSMWVQIFASASYPGYYSNGDKYVASGNTNTYQASVWNNGYTAASQAREIENLTKDNSALSNLYSIATIMEIAAIQVVTDTYGDCPYSQALQAKTGAVFLPVYDKQQDIYNSMLSRLDSVVNMLDVTKATPTNDAFSYHGDVAKWKKFGNSLMLRIAMRLTKADAATAQKYAEKAAAGGTFASVDDNAFLMYDNANGFRNGNSAALVTQSDYSEVRWGKMLIDMLKSAADPRLPVIAEVPAAGLANSANESLAGNSDPAVQMGMPNGYDQNGGATDITKAPGYTAGTGAGSDYNPIGSYSRPKTALYLDLSAPLFILTYPETEFLLAEAAARGWNVGATAAVHYANGIAGSLQSYGQYNATGTISAATATAYAAANPLMDNSLEQINDQYWITTGTLFNFTEAWSNWRRSGYPVLTPVNYTGNFSGGQIPRRQPYPLAEANTNGANFQSAVSGLSGGDTWSSRVWWDK